MKFAMFYEIPVPKPWGPRSETTRTATRSRGEARRPHGLPLVLDGRAPLLDEYSHCSNPEVLYGRLSAVTENLRLGYGVRLLPKPYNHPVRTAESVAVLDQISGGRVEFGTGRSSTRAEIEGFGIDPLESRRCGTRRSATSSAAGPTTSTSSRASTGRCRAARAPQALPGPAPADLGRDASVEGHCEIGRAGSACCRSRSATRRSSSRSASRTTAGQADCKQPVGKFRNSTAATFTMVHCDDTNERARTVAEESFVWYPKTAAS